MATEPKVAKYLDMPIQHASDKLLRSMKRGRNKAFLTGLLTKLRARVPGLVMRTTFIVGLPGETEADFEELKAFVKEQRFERVGVFEYSQEGGEHRAAGVNGEPDRRRRPRPSAAAGELMAIQRRINREQNKALIGKRVQVLVEGASPETEHLLVGRMEGQAPEVDGLTYINDGMGYPGELVTLEITQAADYDVVGHIVERAATKAPKARSAPNCEAADRAGLELAGRGVTPPLGPSAFGRGMTSLQMRAAEERPHSNPTRGGSFRAIHLEWRHPSPEGGPGVAPIARRIA